MASKILIIYLRLFIFIGMISSINSKAFNFQTTQDHLPKFTSSEHQVLFQKIGFYAATVQYLHVVIPIPLQETISSLVAMSDELGRYQKEQNKPGNPMAAINGHLIKAARTRIAKVVNNIYAIIDSLPEGHTLTKRQLGAILGAVGGAVGTLMGLFNTFEIQKIAAGVGENRKRINDVIDITKINTEHLENLRLSTDKLSNIITAMLKDNPAQLLSEIEMTMDNANNAVNRITNMVQQAQNKRLSVDLLTPDTLKQVFNHLQDQADKQGLELLITQPSDLFQIDTSYLHGNKTVTLILHVPMVAEDNKLNLLQFIPFPLSQSLGANTTVTPKVDKDLIAVGKHHQYKILGQTDLAACTKLGQNFLCEGRSVLRTDIEDSCLGSLYMHHLPGTLKNCHFELGETKEHVFQTGPSQWLVSAPQTFSSVMQCEKSHDTIFIKPISSITVNPGCKLYLKSHVIQPDSNQRSTFEIRHHSWEWDIKHLFHTSNLTDIAEELVQLRKQGSFIVTAKDLQKLQPFTDSEINEWFHPNYIAIGFYTLAAIFTLYLAFRFYKWYTKEELQPLDVALNHLNRKERLEFLKLKKEVQDYEDDLEMNHRHIIRIGDRPGRINMSDYTVEQPTNPISSEHI
jgi:hypothetical protein